MKKYIFIIIIFVMVFSMVSCNRNSGNKASAAPTQISPQAETTATQSFGSETANNIITPTEIIGINKYNVILALINFYQSKYFDICRAGKLFNIGDDSYEMKKSDLFVDVKSKISPDNTYFKKFNEIEVELSDSDKDHYSNPITIYATQYDIYDNYLNKLYSDIKNKIPEEAFSELKKVEMQWVKDKENFLKINVLGKGNETYPQAGAFKVDVTKFRCLMLILYLS